MAPRSLHPYNTSVIVTRPATTQTLIDGMIDPWDEAAPAVIPPIDVEPHCVCDGLLAVFSNHKVEQTEQVWERVTVNMTSEPFPARQGDQVTDTDGRVWQIESVEQRPGIGGARGIRAYTRCVIWRYLTADSPV